MIITPVILAGGSGTRLWPLSRISRPKQFLKLCSQHTLFQETVLRGEEATQSPPIIVTRDAYKTRCIDELKAIGSKNTHIITEPCAKNTAPAILLAALHAYYNCHDALLLILPSDHIIENTNLFGAAIANGAEAAQNSSLVIFGVSPQYAHTGYGYIRNASQPEFTEKPNKKTANQYFRSGEHYWNSGMLMVSASNYISAFKEFEPQLYADVLTAYQNAKTQDSVTAIHGKDYAPCKSISNDYAILEHSDNLQMITMHDTGWSDIGSWGALLRALLRNCLKRACNSKRAKT